MKTKLLPCALALVAIALLVHALRPPLKAAHEPPRREVVILHSQEDFSYVETNNFHAFAYRGYTIFNADSSAGAPHYVTPVRFWRTDAQGYTVPGSYGMSNA